MTKVIFDLEKFKEWLEEISSEKMYSLDISESPNAILCCSYYYGPDEDGSIFQGTTVGIVGRIED